jgi:putative transposase
MAGLLEPAKLCSSSLFTDWHGTAAALTEQRAITLDAAFASHPIRFKGVAPKPPVLPTAAWINPPKK